ncbi:MAG: 2TM domain-containing protein [Candidatus Bathyarchaeia archaeon]
MSSDGELRLKAVRRAEAKAGFFIHLGIYIIVNIFLTIVWWFTGGNTGSFPWFIFPLLGWGIGVVAHFLAVYMETGYVEKMTEKEYRKLREKT